MDNSINLYVFDFVITVLFVLGRAIIFFHIGLHIEFSAVESSEIYVMMNCPSNSQNSLFLFNKIQRRLAPSPVVPDDDVASVKTGDLYYRSSFSPSWSLWAAILAGNGLSEWPEAEVEAEVLELRWVRWVEANEFWKCCFGRFDGVN